MHWKRKSKYHIVSEEGYIISAARVKGEWVFQGITPQGESLKLGASRECKDACQQHYEENK